MASEKHVGRGKVVTAQSREIIWNVLKFFKEEAQNERPIIPIANYRERLLRATGISVSTYTRINREARNAQNNRYADLLFSSLEVTVKNESTTNTANENVTPVVEEKPTSTNTVMPDFAQKLITTNPGNQNLMPIATQKPNTTNTVMPYFAQKLITTNAGNQNVMPNASQKPNTTNTVMPVFALKLTATNTGKESVMLVSAQKLNTTNEVMPVQPNTTNAVNQSVMPVVPKKPITIRKVLKTSKNSAHKEKMAAKIPLVSKIRAGQPLKKRQVMPALPQKLIKIRKVSKSSGNLVDKEKIASMISVVSRKMHAGQSLHSGQKKSEPPLLHIKKEEPLIDTEIMDTSNIDSSNIDSIPIKTEDLYDLADGPLSHYPPLNC